MSEPQFIAEPGKQDILMTAILDASPEIVFRVFCDPTLIPHWWGPAYLTTIVDVMDVRPGGSWRFVQTEPDGQTYAFHGFYHEVVPDQRVTFTFEYEDMPGHILMETVRFEALEGGKTKMIDASVFQSVEDRDGMLQAGMDEGAQESMERFERLLKR